jgi:acetyltransferase-like isoleucine patch superfamily enzyme
MTGLRHGTFLLAEIALRLCIVPTLRARLLKLLGATIGRNVRVYECRFINLETGFRNLSLGDDVHVGTDCLLDLKGPVRVGAGSTLSPRVTLISHSDPGSAHGALLALKYPPEARGVIIGEQCWIGAGAMLLSGSVVADHTVVGAMALVRGRLESHSLYAGVPARPIKCLSPV